MKTAIFLFSLIVAICGAKVYPPCDEGMKCGIVAPRSTPNLQFSCAFVEGSGPSAPKGQVFFLHGNDGPRSKGMFFSLMLELAPLGYDVLACDQRGYSPGASPSNYSAYHYDELVSDLFHIVDASGFGDRFGGKFHLVSHNQGSRVSWHAIATRPEARERLLSFTSLSIPHSDVFSDALFGPALDNEQAESSQYVRMLVLPNATHVYDDRIFDVLCRKEGWPTPEACQRTLWWYNGAIDSGAMALAPMMPYDGAAKFIGIPEDVVRNLTQYPTTGVPQTARVGKVDEFPVLYACGSADTSDLCKQAFSDESAELISDYKYLRLGLCGHDVLGCEDDGQRKELERTIVDHIQSVYRGMPDDSVSFRGFGTRVDGESRPRIKQ